VSAHFKPPPDAGQLAVSPNDIIDAGRGLLVANCREDGDRAVCLAADLEHRAVPRISRVRHCLLPLRLADGELETDYAAEHHCSFWSW
jgi:hypothetical protein